ncbi:MAG TPA: hypothetical protein VGS27_21965 [Candidatus Sulfotelmatobacter sp.]|nr:hypothetical protein [Candidatus Sulfotelmatobacter sp.]HEV2468770.1 hypothetical protein [Candidatus Sulfotelmatobacter sp.]
MADYLLAFGAAFLAAIWRVTKVKRNAPKEKHAVTEYADAFLFPDEKEDE